MKNLHQRFLTIITLFFISFIHAGFIANTLVQTPKGPMPIALLDINDNVISSNLCDACCAAPITRIAKESVTLFTILVVDGETICATDDQKFYLVHEQRWCQAQDIKAGQFLLRQDFGSIRVDSVQIMQALDEPLFFFDISVRGDHTYCVSRHNIVAHNVVFAIPILSWGAGVAATWFEGVTLANTLSALGTALFFAALEKKMGVDTRTEIGADGTINGQPLPGTEEYHRINNPLPGGHVQSGPQLNPGNPCPCGHPCGTLCNCQCSCGCGRAKEKSKRESIRPQVQTYEQARNQAYEIIKDIDPHAGEPHIGTVGVGLGKIVGRSWYGDKVIVRLDWDEVVGPHINVTDYREGKGIKGKVVAIPFEGTLETVQSLLSHLNTKASLEAAKSIFEKTENIKDLTAMIEALKHLN